MDNQTTIRVDLGIDARKFIQQVQLNNETIEDQVKQGLELAIKDISEGDNFIQAVRENTKKELLDIVSTKVLSWEVRGKLSKSIEEKIGKKIDEYADKIAESVTKNLENE
jgi:hypothetical protein